MNLEAHSQLIGYWRGAQVTNACWGMRAMRVAVSLARAHVVPMSTPLVHVVQLMRVREL